MLEFIKNQQYKYIRVLGMVYFRMVCQKSIDIYKVLEPLLGDYRKVCLREISGKFTVVHIDEIADRLIRDETFCDVMLPRIPRRYVLEANGTLDGPRKSVLDSGMNEVKPKDDEEE